MAGRGLNAADPQDRLTVSAEREPGAGEVGDYEWDFQLDQWRVSPKLAALTGMAPGVAPARRGQALYDYVHPDDLASVRPAIADELRLNGRCDIRFRFIRPDDGRVLWLCTTAVALRGRHGQLIRAVGVVRDVSSDRDGVDLREGLVAELDHRVKNLLASVQSLAAQTARRTVSLEAFLKTFFGRLEAMAAAHTLLTATRWRGADIAHVAAAELGGLAQGQARWDGPEITLTPRATHALTLALHELAANAVQYGALSSEAGRVDVTWRNLDAAGFELVWTEKNGPIVSPPTRRGFGSTLLERVTARELGGVATLEFRPEGLRAVLSAGAVAQSVRPTPEAARAAESSASRESGLPALIAHSAPPDADIRGLKVLIVEDAMLLALELEAGLTECGASVVATAGDIDEARRLLHLDFDVAVLDADLNGFAVTPIAHALAGRGVPFIFATGYSGAGAPPAGFAVPVVRKPYNIRQIAAALVQAIATARAVGTV